MQFLLSTGSLYTYGIERCFELARRAGFDGLEIMVDHRWDTRQPAYLRRLSNRHGLPILAVHSPFVPVVPGWPDDEPGRIRHSVALAEAVGARVVVHHLPDRMGSLWLHAGAWRQRIPVPFWDRHRGYRHWLENGYQEFQETTEVLLCIENMPALRRLRRRWQLNHWNTPEEILRFPHLTLDTTHLGTWGLDPAEVYARWQGHVRHVHLSNFDGQEHCRPEQGHLRLDRLLTCLAADRYDGAVTLELRPEVLEAGGSDEHVVNLLAESLSRCRGWAAPP